MIREGYDSIQRNWAALLQYLAILLPFHIANLVTGEFIRGNAAAVDPALILLYDFAGVVVVAAGYAMAQSVVFARIGAEIDRPCWKYDGAADAIRRFFAFWFIMDLIAISLGNILIPLGAQAGGSSEVMAMLTWIMIAGVVVPFGACVMFYGHARKQEIDEALNTLAAQVPRLLGVLLLTWGVSFFLHLIVADGGIPVWAYPLLTIIEGYVDCVVFACTWIICMIHRDEEPEDHDFDF